MLTAFDMFCGAGGSSTGAREAGFAVRGGIDRCPLAAAAYRANFPEAECWNAKVEDTAPAEIASRLKRIDLLLASPECTSHSPAQKKTCRSEESKNLSFQVLRYARALNPRWVVVENVPGMRKWNRYPEFLEGLQELGFGIKAHILNAARFGVPQSRSRLFITACRDTQPPEIQHQPGPQPTVADILDADGTWPTTPLHTSHRAKPTLERAERAMQALGQEASFLIVYYGRDGAGGWQSLERPLRTVTTLDRFALVTPDPAGHRMRMLQPPELQRAMGLPQTFSLPCTSRRDRIRLLGNGVCPPVIRAILEQAILPAACLPPSKFHHPPPEAVHVQP